jgi:hypothetical protein
MLCCLITYSKSKESFLKTVLALVHIEYRVFLCSDDEVAWNSSYSCKFKRRSDRLRLFVVTMLCDCVPPLSTRQFHYHRFCYLNVHHGGDRVAGAFQWRQPLRRRRNAPSLPQPLLDWTLPVSPAPIQLPFAQCRCNYYNNQLANAQWSTARRQMMVKADLSNGLLICRHCTCGDHERWLKNSKNDQHVPGVYWTCGCCHISQYTHVSYVFEGEHCVNKSQWYNASIVMFEYFEVVSQSNW